MNCPNTCPYINGDTSQQGVIIHPQGNPITLTIPMTSVCETVSNGTDVKDDRNFPIYDVSVALVKGKNAYTYTPRISVNTITFNDEGTLPVGTYGIEIKYRGTDGKHYRWKAESMLRIVDAGEGDYTTNEYNIMAYYPKVYGRVSAIDVTDTEVIITEGRGYTGDTTPNDGNADISADYGSQQIEITDNEVILHI